MTDRLRLALEPHVVRRALLYAVVVGSILITINHSDAIVRGEVDLARALRMGLTCLVPYLVSTLSSVGALRRVQQSEEAGGDAAPRAGRPNNPP